MFIFKLLSERFKNTLGVSAGKVQSYCILIMPNTE